jgi:hypothetical protein
MQPTLSPILAFTSEISDRLQQLSQIASACGPEPTPTQELQILRAYCLVYDKIFAQIAASPAEVFGSSEFVRLTLPLMEGTARELAEFEQELAQDESCAPLLAPARELLARLSQSISTLKQR